jgi:hypothetical protein
MFKTVIQQGRSERKGEAYGFEMYVEPLNDARTKLGTGFNILERAGGWCKPA